MAGIQVDGANQKVVLDSDGDTYLEAATDDTIKVYVAGAHDATISANAINVLSGTTLTIDSGATITNSGTANGFSSADPASADGDSLGTASLEWSDLFLADGGIIKFGNDQDVLLTHVADTGLLLNSTNVIQFNDASQNIGAPSATVLDINATDEIELNATAVDLNGTLDVSGTSTLTGAVTASAGITSTAASNTFGASSFNDANITNVGTIAADRILGDADSDSFMDFPGSDVVTINTGDNIRFRIDSSGILSTGGETAPDVSKGGITLNQAQFDTPLMTFKSSDVAHGVTDTAETDTYGTFAKAVAGEGILDIQGFGSSYKGLQLHGTIVNIDGNYATGGVAAVMIDGHAKSGSAQATIGGNKSILAVRDNGTSRFFLDSDGDFHADSSSTTFDDYDDAHLVRALDLSKETTIDSKFDKFIAYNHEHLADLKLVGREKDGSPNHFVNVCGMQRLHNGAIWQQYEKHQRLLEAVYDLAEVSVGKEKADAILEKHEVKRLQ